MIRLHHSLQNIAISDVVIDKEMANLISEGLKSNFTSKFELVNCRFSDKQALQIIVQSLQSNQSVNVLKFDGSASAVDGGGCLGGFQGYQMNPICGLIVSDRGDTKFDN
jgi:hypothetical protein